MRKGGREGKEYVQPGRTIQSAQCHSVVATSVSMELF